MKIMSFLQDFKTSLVSEHQKNNSIQVKIEKNKILYNVNMLFIGDKKNDRYADTDKTFEELAMQAFTNVRGLFENVNESIVKVETKINIEDISSLRKIENGVLETDVQIVNRITAGKTNKKYVIVVFYDMNNGGFPKELKNFTYSLGGTIPVDNNKLVDWSYSVNHFIDGNSHNTNDTDGWKNSKGRWFVNSLTHELLHIFGIGDAYDNPKGKRLRIPSYLANESDVMRWHYENTFLSNLEIFMLQEAFKTKRMQRFEDDFEKWKIFIDKNGLKYTRLNERMHSNSLPPKIEELNIVPQADFVILFGKAWMSENGNCIVYVQGHYSGVRFSINAISFAKKLLQITYRTAECRGSILKVNGRVENIEFSDTNWIWAKLAVEVQINIGTNIIEITGGYISEYAPDFAKFEILSKIGEMS